MLRMLTFLIFAGTVVTSSSGNLDSMNKTICPDNQFSCNNGLCIGEEMRCDGTNQCGDSSDEAGCEYVLCNDSEFFRCKNHRCVSRTFVCDNEDDCGDYSDEVDCESFQHKLNTSCEVGHWQCTDKLCIPEEFVCNGEPDCLDHSDEGIGCSKQIHCDGFKCNNSHCIPLEWRCDGRDDCHDNSDETECENYFDPKKCTLDERKFLCADKTKCLEFNFVCDGQAHCPDKSDESGLCSNPIYSCENHNCSHDCVSLPNGPRCLCPTGYHNIDEKHCKDINECEQYGICDQKCKNTQGSYECICEHKYMLQEDGKTCKAVSGEAMMYFSSKTEIRLYTLTTHLYFPIVTNVKQVVGVDFDGVNIYWTDVFSEHETIVKAKEDGSDKEALVTSGLGLPEDLAVDWLTKNIYFTDADKKHIGVCTNDGSVCTVLINENIRKPRALVLNVEDGDMYWTDWGKPAEIAHAYMDGSGHESFVSEGITWPNGLALDYNNQRLYWTDAKKMSLESIRLDGTDRRVVLSGIVKHPYAIAIFENRLYWSDWETHAIESCDKFTGKNHHTVIREDDEYIYGLTIHHAALHTRIDNPCTLSFCSDICLLKGSSGYTCACSQDKELGSDKHTCKETRKKQMLIAGAKNMLLHIEHQTLGKHNVDLLPTTVKNIGSMTYNSLNNTVYVSDLDVKKIISINLSKGISTPLDIKRLGKIISMDYDPIGNNLYMCDEEMATLDVVNLNTMAKKTLLHDLQGEIPESIALVPDEGVMFVALRKKQFGAHIDRMYMDGSGRTHAIDSGLLGPINLYYDSDLHRIFFSDGDAENIEITSVDGDERHSFRSLTTSPIGLTGLSSDIFWVNEHSRRLYWTKKTGESSINQKITLDIPIAVDRLYITAVTPKTTHSSICHVNNGNCSHLCLVSHKSIICACPVGMSLTTDNRTCTQRVQCASTEYLCQHSNECILKSLRCNGHDDCPLKEDEMDCETVNHCRAGYFQCKDGECVKEHQVCDHIYDCIDKSDEHNCKNDGNSTQCPPDHFKCFDGECISEMFLCDSHKDCDDGSDEAYCESSTCASSEFRCDSGTCIPHTWECDQDYDCDDMSDEHARCSTVSCDSDMFTCNNGKCIAQSFRCDDLDDCGDNSDELDCSLRSVSSCKLEEFACTSNTSICLLHSARCNGISECPHHEDEKDCSNCNLDEFNCDNKKCISVQWLCDGTNDCEDNSDEKPELCKGEKKNVFTNHAHVPCGNGFRCKTGSCIDFPLVCNDKPDCYDGSDEGGQCSSACVGGSNPCSQDCIRTPQGPLCKCKPGFRLMGDGHSCVDENECQEDPPICSQLCVNHEGGYLCDCYKGYMLRSDKKSCKAVGSSMSLIFTTDNQIRELQQKSNSLQMLFSEDMPQITGLDVSAKNNFIYFSTENSEIIQRINVKTKIRDYMEHVGRVEKIALEWSTNNLYYVNTNPESKSISICNFEDMLCAKLIDVGLHRQVSALTVDSVNGLLFYSLTSWWVFNSPSYVIYKSNLDGTYTEELVNSTKGYITGLTYDFNKKELYYIDQHQQQASKISYDGKTKVTLFSNLTRPVGLKFFENHLYYLTSNGHLVKCKLFSPRACDALKLHGYSNELFTIGQEGLQPEVQNVCKNHSCSYMCVSNRTNFRCVCEDGSFVSVGEDCSESERGSEDDGRQYRIKFHSVALGDQKSDTKNTNSTLISAIVISLLMIALGLGLIYYARRKNRGKLNISMRFYNPTYENHADDLEKPMLQPGQHEYSNPVHDVEHHAKLTSKHLNHIADA